MDSTMNNNVANRKPGCLADLATEDRVDVQDLTHRMVCRDGWHAFVLVAIEEVFLEGNGVVIVQHTPGRAWPCSPFNRVEGVSPEEEPSH
jgi:hypothetical protein